MSEDLYTQKLSELFIKLFGEEDFTIWKQIERTTDAYEQDEESKRIDAELQRHDYVLNEVQRLTKPDVLGLLETLLERVVYRAATNSWPSPDGIMFPIAYAKLKLVTAQAKWLLLPENLPVGVDRAKLVNALASVRARADDQEAIKEIRASIFIIRDELANARVSTGVQAGAPTPVGVQDHHGESLERLLSLVESAKEANSKGLALERLVGRLLGTVTGFSDVKRRIVTATEEIDFEFTNGSKEPWLAREGALVLVECKNWSTSCGKDEVVLFMSKLEGRKGRCSLGLFVSWNGFTSTVRKELLRSSHERAMIILLDGEAIRAAVKETAFLPVLKKAWGDAVNT